jgi:hypothetical protein
LLTVFVAVDGGGETARISWKWFLILANRRRVSGPPGRKRRPALPYPQENTSRFTHSVERMDKTLLPSQFDSDKSKLLR